MIMQPNPDTSLLREVGSAALKVDWFARAWRWHAPFRALVSYLFCVLVTLIGLAVWAKTMGWAAVPWLIGSGVLVALLIVTLPFAASATVPVWFAGIFRHQAGGERGFSAQDGFNGGSAYVSEMWQFTKNCLFYSPLTFFGVGFFRVEDNLLGVIPFLGISLALIIHYNGTRGSFFRSLVVLIYTGIILWILGTWIPPVAERQRQFASWWELNMARNQADRASDAQNADQHDKDELTANTCFNKLKKQAEPPTQEDKDRCEALRKSVGKYVYRNAAERARAEANAAVRSARVTAAAACWKGITPKSDTEAIAKCEALDKDIDQPLVAVTPPAPPPPQGTTGAGGTTATTTAASGNPACKKLDKLYEFDPKRHGNRIAGGTLQAGHYQVKVTGNSQEDFVIHAWGHTLPIENGWMEIHTGSALPIQLGMKNGRQEPVRVEIKQCETTRT